MNLTKIEKPFGLLSKKKQTALKAYYEAGGAVQLYMGDCIWVAVEKALWHEDCCYRAKPAEPTKPKIPWDILADELICAARDEYGLIFAYTEDPLLITEYWWTEARHQKLSFLKIDPGTCDWKDSLVYRPGHEPEGE